MNDRYRMPVGSRAKTACLTLCGVALLLQGCEMNLGFQGVKGSGVSTTRTFDVEKFDQVRFSGSGEFNIKCGETESVSVSFDDNLMEFVEVSVENGKLRFDVTESYSSGNGLQVDVTVPELNRVELYGAVTAKLTNCSGEKLSVEIAGASTIIADGTVDTVDVEASGACTLKLLDLEARNGIIDMSGAGSARVHVTEKLDAKLSGVGSLKYKGDPEVKKSISGVGTVSRID